MQRLLQFIRSHREQLLIILALTAAFILTSTVTSIITSSNERSNIIRELVEIQKIQSTTLEDYRRDFIQKGLLARQVYQWSWYKSVNTKVGNLNLNKYYAMSLVEFNQLLEWSWEFNRQLSIPPDSWENYIMLAKWILESSIYLQAEHKTGEIIHMAGYTRPGFEHALIQYKYKMNINPGHKFYIRDLDIARTISDQEIRQIFSTTDNVLKFDYTFIHYLLMKYDYKWDWVLTAFHFGEDKTEYWNGLGLKDIPNFRLDGQWETHYLREYYQTVFEIAKGIADGTFSRISRYEETVNRLAHRDARRDRFISVLKLKARSEDKFRDLEEKYNLLRNDFKEYKEVNEQILQQMAELNDMSLADQNNSDIKEQIRQLKKRIRQTFKHLKFPNRQVQTNVHTN